MKKVCNSFFEKGKLVEVNEEFSRSFQYFQLQSENKHAHGFLFVYCFQGCLSSAQFFRPGSAVSTAGEYLNNTYY
jgi:hypothetical protein